MSLGYPLEPWYLNPRKPKMPSKVVDLRTPKKPSDTEKAARVARVLHLTPENSNVKRNGRPRLVSSGLSSSWLTEKEIEATEEALAAVEHPPVPIGDLAPEDYSYDESVQSWVYTADTPWGRIDEETHEEYEWFNMYRSLGPGRRSIARISTHYNKRHEIVSTAAKLREWDYRVSAWDDYRERLFQIETVENIKRMAQRHAQKAADGIAATTIIFDKILSVVSSDKFEDELAEMSAGQLIKLAQGTARILPSLTGIERLSLGMPTDVTHNIEERRINVQGVDDILDLISGIAGIIGAARAPAEEQILDLRSTDQSTFAGLNPPSE